MPILTYCTFKGLRTKSAATTADSESWRGKKKQATLSVAVVAHKIRIDWNGEKKLDQVAISNARPTCMYRDMFLDI